MKKWKYDIQKIDEKKTVETLNRLGELGWELVQANPPYYYLKQEQPTK
jgi:hypothetical protein